MFEKKTHPFIRLLQHIKVRRVKISITVYTSLHSTTHYKARPFPPNLYRMNIKLHYPARPCFYWSPVPPSTAQPIRHRFTNTYKGSHWFRGALNAAITHLTVSMINGIPTRSKFPTSPVGMGRGGCYPTCLHHQRGPFLLNLIRFATPSL